MKTKLGLIEIVPELAEVEASLKNIVQSCVEDIGYLDTFLLEGSGKKLRPALFLASARIHWEDVSSFIPLAVSLELIHTATLIHDDVVDKAARRRNLPTLNYALGNKMAVLFGDYLFAKAFTILTSSGSIEIINLIASVVKKMSLGELKQQVDAFNVDITEEDYLERIKQKTALFIASCCLAGCLTAEASEKLRTAFYNFGLNLGMAFQIIDDVLDYHVDGHNTGKDCFIDIRNGIVTLPLIHALKFSRRREEISLLLKKGRLDNHDLLMLLEEILQAGGIDYSLEKAKRYIEQALNHIGLIPSKKVAESLNEITRVVCRGMI